MPKISVVTSVYNCERFVGETIQSVINQTFTDWEYILIDDCSKDRSAEIIQSFADKDPRIRLIRNEQNQGQCRNLNHGIQLAKGEYIARLDHDDLCYPERFQKQLDYMEAHKETVLCGCRMDMWQDGIVKPGE
ncbi:MAG: glycosyltransferase family 2 protein, partial [Treponema sp.]|nr:glycosyltransferase family 2 protein [Treponema sp.]